MIQTVPQKKKTLKGKSNISVTMLAHSVAATYGNKQEIYTFEAEIPRIILAEVNTHRATSKNLQSSRAVPLSSAITLVEQNAFFPVHWGKNQSGMTSKEEFVGDELETVQALWSKSLHQTIDIARELDQYKPHKQWAARILEPYMMVKAVITSTRRGFDNLLWLRDDMDAQPEFQEAAKLFKQSIDESTAFQLSNGEWHLPYVNCYRKDDGELVYVDSNEQIISLDDARKISASCCAQASYRKLNETREKALEIYGKLFSGRKPHMSPTEHQATPIDYFNLNVFDPTQWDDGVTHVDRSGVLHSGNLTDWIQYRQILPNNVFVEN